MHRWLVTVVAVLAALATLQPAIAIDVSLNTKVKRLEAAVSASGGAYRTTIGNAELFDLVYDKQRNFSAFVVFTALDPQHRCKPCVDFQSELALVASAWGRQRKPGRMYIIQLDYNEKNAGAFQQLQLRSVPFVAHFPPTEGPLAKPRKGSDNYESYDLNQRGLDAKDFAAYIEQQTDIKLNILRPINWGLYVGVGAALLLAAVLIRVFAEAFIAFFANKNLWMVLSLGGSIFFCAGHMWNSIRGPEFAGVRDGRPEFFAPGFQSQFVVESQIVAMLYSLTAVVFVALAAKVPTIKNPELQRAGFWAAVIGFWLLYSYLLRVFRYKNSGYPFRAFF